MAVKGFHNVDSHTWSRHRGAAVDDLFNIFQNNRFGFNIVFDKFVIVCKHLLYHIHENIME